MNSDPVRIQDNKITKLISTHLLKVKKKIYIVFKSKPKNVVYLLGLGTDLKIFFWRLKMV